MIKKILIISLSVFIQVSGNSQNKNVQNAYNSFRQEKDGNKHKMAEAKYFIDLAYGNESTSNDPKMWNYRAKIYLEIMLNHIELDSEAPFKATESYIRCLDRDKKGRIAVRKWTREEEVLDGLYKCGYTLFNSAVEDYNNKEYETAIRKYQEIFRIIPLDKNNLLTRNNIVPDVIYKNMYLAANQMNDIDLQIEYLNKSIDNGTEDHEIYYYLSNTYTSIEEYEKAREIIELGIEKFPYEIILINAEIDLSLKRGDSAEDIIIKLSNAIELDNTNEVIYIIRSQMYLKIDEFDNAISDLNEAIEINPNSASANNNLASIYLTKTEPLIEERNELSYRKEKEIENLDKKIKELYQNAIPYLSRYIEIIESNGEKDNSALNTLASLYYQLDMVDKSEEIRNKIK